MDNTLVLMKGIEKHFPGVHALSQARFDLHPGEVHALVGENGAGKSTLMKILSGIYSKDGGRIVVRDRDVDIPNPRAAQQLGISMIHQELNLMNHLTIAQNIFIGREPRQAIPFLLDEKKINQDAIKYLDMLNLKLNPRARVADLSVAKQQMVEIAVSRPGCCGSAHDGRPRPPRGLAGRSFAYTE
jgi:ribose transport system ATP-binding protein